VKGEKVVIVLNTTPESINGVWI